MPDPIDDLPTGDELEDEPCYKEPRCDPADKKRYGFPPQRVIAEKLAQPDYQWKKPRIQR